MKALKLFGTLTFAIIGNLLFAQTTLVGEQAKGKIREASRIELHKNGNFKYVVLEKESNISEQSADGWINNLMQGSSPQSIFKQEKITNDALGFTHKEYRQWVGANRVEHSVLKLHFRYGKLESFNGEYAAIKSPLAIIEKISEAKAIEIGLNYFADSLVTAASTIATLQEKLFIKNKTDELRLCYKIDMNASPRFPKRAFLYIDVSTGEIISSESRIHYADVIARAKTKYCDTVFIKTDSINSSTYYLRENGARKINTLDLNQGTSYSSAVQFTNNTKFWNTVTNLDNAAYDAHYGAEKTWDYFNNTFGLNSYDGAGATINSYVHYDMGFVNAFWDGTQMTYGDGDGVNYGPLTSTDVVGHEIMHAITENSAALVYANESGALNESFSDIFGVVIDYYANPTTANFLMGDQFAISGQPFRNLSDPNVTQDPDTYMGTYWDPGMEVHKNSPPSTYAFYLQCVGGSGTNDIGSNYSVASISMDHAAKIAYRNLSVYLSPNSSYADARTYAIQSAIDLYGACSPEVINVTNSWYAVGVGSAFNNAIAASFTSNDSLVCGIPANVTFVNSSLNSTSYLWDFGDGTTSTATNPSHSYASYGNYNVQLISNGTTACGNSDTIIKTAYIKVINNPTPIAATCMNTSSAYCCNAGISNVTLGSINFNSGNGSEGMYKDFSCGNSSNLIAGNPYPINITTSSTALQFVNVYIDYNNNGSFGAGELAYSSSAAAGSHNGYIFTPISAVLGVPLRMRVLSSLSAITGSCISLNNGQGEDYTLIFSAASGAPVADFTYNPSVVTVGSPVNFTDLSTNTPTSWSWAINGASPSSSAIKNPTATFAAAGTYSITLVATNSSGSSSITKTITVTNSFNLCNPSTMQAVTSTSGLLYDSGGPSGVYGNSENCSFLISPICADSIKLNLLSFNTESGYDYLRIYDGTSYTAPLLFANSGNLSSMPTIIATSGHMFITFNSDGSQTYSGFSANWQTVQFPSVLPSANFSYIPSNPALLDTINFTNLSSSAAIAWNWDFGDGSTSTLQNPKHVYANAGTYNVRLIAQSCGAVDTFITLITTQGAPIINHSPASFNLSIGCNDTVNLNLQISNSGSGTLNWQNVQNVTSNLNLLVWHYGADMNFGGEYQNTFTALNQHYNNYILDTTSTTSAAVLQSKLAGKSTLLVLENENGSTIGINNCATAIQTFVQNGGTVIFLGDTKNVLGSGIFSGTYVGNLSGNIQISNTSHPLATALPATVNNQNATLAYNFTNANIVKIAHIVGNPASQIVSYLPYGSGKAIYIGFDYFLFNSDGGKLLANAVEWGLTTSANTSSSNVYCIPSNGSITPGSSTHVNLQISSTGLVGGLDTLFAYITSNDPMLILDSVPIYLNISYLPCVSFGHILGNSCSGDITFKDSTSNSPTSWLWSFGDGSTSTMQNPTHNYTVAGTYTVTLIATNSFGTDSISKTIFIANVGAPIAANCTPSSSNISGYGITNISIASINKTSTGSSLSYEDFTCPLGHTRQLSEVNPLFSQLYA